MDPCRIEQRGQSSRRQLLRFPEIIPSFPIGESHFAMTSPGSSMVIQLLS